MWGAWVAVDNRPRMHQVISTNLVHIESRVIRIGKLTDYGFVLLSHMVRRSDQGLTSTSAARLTGLPQPSVRKILKSLARAGILLSERGAQGGYRLARPADSVSVAEVIDAIEGPISLTACSGDDADTCEYFGSCALETNWSRINSTIKGALAGITLSEIAEPSQPRLVAIRRKPA